jgi:hypothetical protein
MCAPKIRGGRAEEVDRMVEWWRGQGGSVLFATFTVPHDAGDALEVTWDLVARAWSKMIGRRAYKRLGQLVGVDGRIHYVRVADVTVGPNGWHPHLHVVLFVRGDLDDWMLEHAGDVLDGLWRHYVVAQGWRPPQLGVGVKVERVRNHEQVSRYLAKVGVAGIGHEAAGGAGKVAKVGHRTPWQLLGDLADKPTRADWALWHEYERGSWNRRLMTYSQGLKTAAGVAERSDQDLAEDATGFVPVVYLHSRAWWQLRKAGLEAAAIEAAADGAFDDLAALLQRARVPLGLVEVAGPSG